MSAHIKSDIEGYLAGTLLESRRREVDQHAAECESCRKALHKARTRRAHLHREALKRASSEGLPDLLINRLNRRGSDMHVSRGFRWRWVLLVALVAVALFLWQKFQPGINTVPVAPFSAETPTSTVVSTTAVTATAPMDSEVAVSTPSVPAVRRRVPVIPTPTPSTTHENSGAIHPAPSPATAPIDLSVPQPSRVEISTP